MIDERVPFHVRLQQLISEGYQVVEGDERAYSVILRAPMAQTNRRAQRPPQDIAKADRILVADKHGSVIRDETTSY